MQNTKPPFAIFQSFDYKLFYEFMDFQEYS